MRFVAPAIRRPFLLLTVMESERGKFCKYDPMLGWIGKPNVEDNFSNLDCHHHVRQNRYGFRGTEYDFARTRKKRIVVLGDSFVWGFGVGDNDIFTSIIENESKFSMEMVNLGVSGYGTDQEYLLWKSFGMRFKPDEVLLVVTPHVDLLENASPVMYGHPKPIIVFDKLGGYAVLNQPVPRSTPEAKTHDAPPFIAETMAKIHPIARIAAHSALVSAAIVTMARNSELREVLEGQRIIVPRNYITTFPYIYLAPSSVPVDLSDSWRQFFGLLDIFRLDALKHGAKFRLLVVPSILQVYPTLWERFVRLSQLPSASAQWDLEAPNRRIDAYCKRHQVPLIDPLPSLRLAARTNAFLYFPFNTHWTTDAHRIVAEQILAKMQPGRNNSIP